MNNKKGESDSAAIVPIIQDGGAIPLIRGNVP
jgi:hypothetical protein